MLCPTCHSTNPDSNRFCGNCGTAIAARPSFSRRKTDELPKELIEFDRKIPLIAEPGSDRRNRVPEKIREQVQEVVQRDRLREVAERDRLREAAEKNAQASVDAERPVRLPANFFGMDTTSEEPVSEPEIEAPVTRSPVAVAPPPDVTAEPVVDETLRAERVVEVPRKTTTSGNGFLNLEYAPKPSSTGVSGPSFLGLSDAAEEDYLDEDIEESHTRRNVALVLLLLLIGLGATQWSAIRDQALPFVKNGTQRAMMRVRGKVQPAPVATPTDANANGNANAANTPASDASTSASNENANNGQPNLEVAPLNGGVKKPETTTNDSASTSPATNPNATTPGPVTGPSTSAGAAGTAVASGANTASGNAGTAAGANTGTTKEDAASGTARPSNNADAKDSGDSADEVTSEPVKKPAAETKSRKGHKPSAAERPQIAEEQSQAGSVELRQAVAAGDAKTQNTLLWMAVKKGNPEASVRLAENFISGKGVDKNCDQAMMLLRSASAHNYARARGKLGAMYATGECVPQDRVQAYHWMTLALAANPSSEWTAQYRDRLWSQMSPGEQMRAARDK